MSALTPRPAWRGVRPVLAASAAVVLLSATPVAIAGPPDLTGTCWQLDWSLYATGGGFGDGPNNPTHSRTRIVQFTSGAPGSSVNATWLTPQSTGDYPQNTLGPPRSYIARDRYFGEYPGTYRWLGDADPRMVDGKCEPARADCAYMWLEARPLTHPEEHRQPDTRPRNYASLSASDRQSIDLRLLRQELTYQHVRGDRLELEVETVRQKLKISGKASASFPPVLFMFFNMTVAQLDCGQARTLAATFPKAPRPPDEPPLNTVRPPPQTQPGATTEDPKNLFNDLRRVPSSPQSPPP